MTGHHDRLPAPGRRTHRDIDQQLPMNHEKQTLCNVVDNDELELVHQHNTGFDQDGN